MIQDRLPLYKDYETKTGTTVLVYVTGDRQGMETQMASDVLDRLVDHLDLVKTKKISLFIYSRGGETGVGWSIANLIRSFCDEFEVIVPSRAHSAATLLCLGADKIIMTKQATLGPIDPSVNTPLNPQLPGGNPQQRVPVSVESIKGYIQLAKDELHISNACDMKQVLTLLANNIHPIVLGEVFRARTHIRVLASNLLKKQLKRIDSKKEKRIASFLCSEAQSHDYTINRKEARELGLNIGVPDDEMYKWIMAVYKDIEKELELRVPFIPNLMLNVSDRIAYSCRRALIESVKGGSDILISEGKLIKQQVPTPNGMMIQIQDNREREEWRKENV